MHVPLTLSWTTGLLISVGSLCRVDPGPWFWLGIGILILSIIVLLREMREIVRLKHELYDSNLAELNVSRAVRNTASLTERESKAGSVAQSRCLSR